MGDGLCIFYLRPARKKARAVAVLEALSLLGDLGATAPAGGPLSEQGGLFWISIPRQQLQLAQRRLGRLGYTRAVDLVQPLTQPDGGEHGGSHLRLTRWQRRPHCLLSLYEEDQAVLRELAPDRRTFLLETADGDVRPVKGYRGDGQALSRRGLPVCDARMLVNLVFRPQRGVLLDPFAGVGGLVVEAVAGGWTVESCDIDPGLRHGLAALGAAHHVADARRLPLESESVDAIATEPPYDREAAPMLEPALAELYRVLRPGGRLAMLCAAWQAELLRAGASRRGLRGFLDSPVDRKGSSVVVLGWDK